MIGPCGLILIVSPLGQNHDFIITSMIAFVVICVTHDYMTTWQCSQSVFIDYAM